MAIWPVNQGLRLQGLLGGQLQQQRQSLFRATQSAAATAATTEYDVGEMFSEVPPAREIRPSKRLGLLGRLRTEIKEWHGNCLRD